MKKKNILNFKVRDAKISDINSIMELYEEIMDFHTNFENLLIEKNAATKRREEKNILDSIKNPNTKVLLALINNRVIGYFIAVIKKKHSFLKYKKRGSIEDAYIMKYYRRRGLGKKVFNELIGWFKKRGVGHIGVCVNAQNKIGINAWERFGFKEVVKQMTLDL